MKTYHYFLHSIYPQNSIDIFIQFPRIFLCFLFVFLEIILRVRRRQYTALQSFISVSLFGVRLNKNQYFVTQQLLHQVFGLRCISSEGVNSLRSFHTMIIHCTTTDILQFSFFRTFFLYSILNMFSQQTEQLYVLFCILSVCLLFFLFILLFFIHLFMVSESEIPFNLSINIFICIDVNIPIGKLKQRVEINVGNRNA